MRHNERRWLQYLFEMHPPRRTFPCSLQAPLDGPWQWIIMIIDCNHLHISMWKLSVYHHFTSFSAVFCKGNLFLNVHLWNEFCHLCIQIDAGIWALGPYYCINIERNDENRFEYLYGKCFIFIDKLTSRCIPAFSRQLVLFLWKERQQLN